jgi:hypothetical protein
MEAPKIRGFYVEDVGPTWHYHCQHCKVAWALTKPKEGEEVKVGNTLYLLNHAASHDKKR